MAPRHLLPVLLLLVMAPMASARTAPHAKEPIAAPAFNLPARTGSVALDSLRGQVVLVDFWASWCGPCRKSFPWLASLHERMKDHGLTIVAINLDKSREDADEFLKTFPAPFTVAFDPGGKVAEAFKVKAMPSSLVISKTGKILFSHAGFEPKDTAAIERMIQEACAQ